MGLLSNLLDKLVGTPIDATPEAVPPFEQATDRFGRGYWRTDLTTRDPNQELVPVSAAEERRKPEAGGANLIGSKSVWQERWGARFDDPDASRSYHLPVIDLDIPCRLVESSTKGHYHLYIDFPVEEGLYFKALDALADAGIVQRGYADKSAVKGQTCVRPPWLKKTPKERRPTYDWAEEHPVLMDYQF